jgi:transcription elongation factor GreA
MSKSWLTQEAADRLSAELASLETTGRSEIIKKIESARSEGDLKENGGYHAAREEQGKIEARIRQLRYMMEFLLGSREISSGDLDVYSEKSPLGAAVMGAKIGDTKSYNAPNGKTISVKILKAEVYS